MTRIAAGGAWALVPCGLWLVLATPAHAVATVAADTTRAQGVDPLTAGRSASLSAGGGNETLLRFRVHGLGRTPARAVLRLRVTNATFESLAVRVLPPVFGEDDGTPAQLAPQPTAIASVPGANAGGWAEWDVTAAVRGDGDVGLLVSGPLLDVASFSSREGPDAPQLVVTPDDDRGVRLAGLLDARAADTFVADARDDRLDSLDCLDVIAAPAGQGVPGRYIGVYHALIGGVFVSKVATSNDLTTWTHRADVGSHASQPTLASLPDGGFLLAVERDRPDARYVSANNLVLRHYATWAALAAGAFHREVDLPRSLAPTAEGTPALDVRRWNGPEDSQIAITFHYLKDIDVDRQAAGVLTNFDAAGWAPQPDAVINDLSVGLGTRGNLGDRSDVLFEGHPFAVVEAQAIKANFGTWRWYLYDRERKEARLLAIRLPRGSYALGNPTVRALRDPNGESLLLFSGYAFHEGAGPGEAGQFIALRHATTDPLPSSPTSTPAPPHVLPTAVVASAPPVPAPAPAPAPQAWRIDTTPPVARISGRAQRLRKSIAISVTCTDEACHVTTTGTVRVAKVGRATAARTFPLKTVETTIADGMTATVKLSLPARTRAAIRRALRAGRRIAATLRIRIADRAGNARTRRRQVRLML